MISVICNLCTQTAGCRWVGDSWDNEQGDDLFAPWEIFHAFLSADFFHNQLFRKILSGIPSECQQIGSRSGPEHEISTAHKN